MTAKVVDDVGTGVADLAWGIEDAQVIALGEDGAIAAKEAVEAPGDADTEPLHNAGELLRAVGFDDEVEVTALDGPVDDAGAWIAARGDEGA